MSAGIEMTDPEWFQQLIGQLSTEQRKDLDDILRFTDQERSSVQSPCLAALLSAPVVWQPRRINHTRHINHSISVIFYESPTRNDRPSNHLVSWLYSPHQLSDITVALIIPVILIIPLILIILLVTAADCSLMCQPYTISPSAKIVTRSSEK